MNPHRVLSLGAMTALGLALLTGNVAAQTAKDIVGTWKQVTNINIAPDGRRSEPFGSNPNAIITFDANGRFVTVTTRPDVPKFASNNRMQGTTEENKAMVQGGIAYFGTYSVVDKVIVERVEGSTWPNWTGTEQKRPIISLTGDEMKVTVPAASLGGTGEVTFKRVK